MFRSHSVITATVEAVNCKTCLKLETGVEDVGVLGVSQVSISTMISSRYCNSQITTRSASCVLGQFQRRLQVFEPQAVGSLITSPWTDKSIVAASELKLVRVSVLDHSCSPRAIV